MQSIRIAAVSMNSPFGRTAEILDRIGDFCERAATEKVELILFPELIAHLTDIASTLVSNDSGPIEVTVRGIDASPAGANSA